MRPVEKPEALPSRELRDPRRFRPGRRVYDRWWPWRLGSVTRVLRTRVHVRWSDGEECSYDREHLPFLVRM